MGNPQPNIALSPPLRNADLCLERHVRTVEDSLVRQACRQRAEDPAATKAASHERFGHKPRR